ncbi:hypothetical protein HK096_001461, partial [Nowakowskiella sp. JEL0078]
MSESQDISKDIRAIHNFNDVYHLSKDMLKIPLDRLKLNNLQTALTKEDIETIRQILNNSSNFVNELNAGITALHVCATIGQKGLSGIHELLKNDKVQIDSRDLMMRTPLITAAIYENLEVAKILLKFGANVNAVDEIGCCALHYSLLNNDIATLKFLIEMNASLNIIDD